MPRLSQSILLPYPLSLIPYLLSIGSLIPYPLSISSLIPYPLSICSFIWVIQKFDEAIPRASVYQGCCGCIWLSFPPSGSRHNVIRPLFSIASSPNLLPNVIQVYTPSLGGLDSYNALVGPDGSLETLTGDIAEFKVREGGGGRRREGRRGGRSRGREE